LTGSPFRRLLKSPGFQPSLFKPSPIIRSAFSSALSCRQAAKGRNQNQRSPFAVSDRQAQNALAPWRLGVLALKFPCLNRKRRARAGAVPDACPPWLSSAASAFYVV
jgi:hypothetical protein